MTTAPITSQHELGRFEGHSGTVYSVGFSPDGTRLVSGSSDRTVRVWEVVSGREFGRFEGHTNAVRSVSFSPDGTRLASGSWDRTIRVWEVVTGRELARFEGHTDAVWSVSFSPDGTRLASGSHDSTVRVWEVASGRELARFVGHASAVYAVSFSPDGTRLASSSWDDTVRLWEVASGREFGRFEGHASAVFSVSFSPDGTRLASGSDDKTVRVWEVASGRELGRFEGHASAVYGVSFSPDGTRLVSGSADGSVRVWEVPSGRDLRRFEGHARGVNSVSFSPDGARLTSGSDDTNVRLWDVSDLVTHGTVRASTSRSEYLRRQAITVGRATGVLSRDCWVPQLEGGEGDCFGVIQRDGKGAAGIALSRDGRRLYSGHSDGRLRAWDLQDGAMLWQSETRHNRGVQDLAASPDGTRLASRSADSTVRVWEAASGRELGRFEVHTAYAWNVSFSPDGTRVASGCSDSTIRLWEVASGLELGRFEGHASGVTSVSFSPDGMRLASGSYDSTVRVWEVASGRERGRFEGHADLVNSVSFSPDGTLLASGSHDKTVRVLQVPSGRELGRFEGHTYPVNSVSFSPDGTRLASGSEDKTVRVWEMASRRELTRYEFPEYPRRVAWAPSGAFLVSSHYGDTIRIWDARATMPAGDAADTADPLTGGLEALSREQQSFPGLLAVVQRAGGAAPLSWLVDLLALLDKRGRAPARLAVLREHRGAHALSSLGFSGEACFALVLVVLRLMDETLLVSPEFQAPAEVHPSDVLLELPALLAGREVEPVAPPLPLVRVQQALEQVDDRLLTLLAGLGAKACAEEPSLPLRLMGRWPSIMPLAAPERALLSRSLPSELAGQAEGSAFGALPSGITTHGTLHRLLPSSWALPPTVRAYRHARSELFYRARAGQEPPELRPTVLLLDVSPPCRVEPIAAVLRPAAYLLAKALLEAREPCFVVLLGQHNAVRPLEHPLDLFELLAASSDDVPDVPTTLRQAKALRETLCHHDSALSPIIVLLTQTFFGAEDCHLPAPPHLRALFAEYPCRSQPPPFRHHCEHWAALACRHTDQLAHTVAGLLQ